MQGLPEQGLLSVLPGLLQVSIVWTLEAKWATQEQSSKAMSKESQGRFIVKSAVTSLSISACVL